MNVVIINSSSRMKGNSDLLCDEFIRGAKESGNTTEKISLREYCKPLQSMLCVFQNGKVRSER